VSVFDVDHGEYVFILPLTTVQVECRFTLSFGKHWTSSILWFDTGMSIQCDRWLLMGSIESMERWSLVVPLFINLSRAQYCTRSGRGSLWASQRSSAFPEGVVGLAPINHHFIDLVTRSGILQALPRPAFHRTSSGSLPSVQIDGRE